MAVTLLAYVVAFVLLRASIQLKSVPPEQPGHDMSLSYTYGRLPSIGDMAA